MAHTTHDKKGLLNRVRRLRGQIEAIENALEEEKDCSSVLQLIAACRGAMNGLMVKVLDGHVRAHVLDPDKGQASPQAKAADELLSVIKTYLK